MSNVSSYRQRHFTFEGVWSIDDMKLKTYLITRAPEISAPDGMLRSARDHVSSKLPGIRQREGADHGLGYAILHLGEMRSWLLAHWWAFEDIALQTMSSAIVDTADFTCQDHRHFHACVWEQVVISYERNAWVKGMMGDEGASEDYLKDRLADGDY